MGGGGAAPTGSPNADPPGINYEAEKKRLWSVKSSQNIGVNWAWFSVEVRKLIAELKNAPLKDVETINAKFTILRTEFRKRCLEVEDEYLVGLTKAFITSELDMAKLDLAALINEATQQREAKKETKRVKKNTAQQERRKVGGVRGGRKP